MLNQQTRQQFESLEEALTPTRQAALRMLARREYSAFELIDKLCQKGYPKQAAEMALARLQEKNLQSDERFVEAYVNSRKSRGQGPVRIRLELQQLGIGEELLASYLENDDQEWVSIAQQVSRKRFGAGKRTSAAERAKMQRFLQYRGFSFEQIKIAMAKGLDTDGV